MWLKILCALVIQSAISAIELPVRLKVDRQQKVYPGMLDSRPAYQHKIFQQEGRYLKRVNKLNHLTWDEIRPPAKSYNRRIWPKSDYELFAPNKYFKYYHSQKLRNHYIRQIDRGHFQ